MSIQGPSQSDHSPLELSPSFSSECIDIASSIDSPSFCCQNNFALAVDGDNTFHCMCVSDSRADPGRCNTFALTAAHNDCRPESYLVTRTRFFLAMCLSIICIVFVFLLLLSGDIESNTGPSENKREASGEPGGNPPQNKKRKGEKVDSEDDIDFTMIHSAEQPLRYKVPECNKTMLPVGVKKETLSMGSKERKEG